MKTLVVPVDFSPVTARVVDEASAIARPFDARIVPVHVSEPATSVVDLADINLSPPPIDESMVKRARHRLEHRAAEFQAERLTVDFAHVVGLPVREILETAHRRSTIVVGSHGHTALYGLVIGSTASRLLKRAPCLVVVVPALAGSERSRTRPFHEEAPS